MNRTLRSLSLYSSINRCKFILSVAILKVSLVLNTVTLLKPDITIRFIPTYFVAWLVLRGNIISIYPV